MNFVCKVDSLPRLLDDRNRTAVFEQLFGSRRSKFVIEFDD